MVDKVFGNNAELVMGKMVQNVHEVVLKVRKSNHPSLASLFSQLSVNLFVLSSSCLFVCIFVWQNK